jgi:hypothetical protein
MVRADLGVWSPSLKGAFVQVNANNLGDRAFVSGCYGTGNCYWGAGRSVRHRRLRLLKLSEKRSARAVLCG